MRKIALFVILCTLLMPVLYAQNAVSLFNRGEENFQDKNWDDALYYYKKSLEKNPYYTKAILKIIEVNLQKIKNYNEAEQYIKKLLKIDPKNLKGLNFQGLHALIQYNIEKTRDKRSKAEKALNEALKIFSKITKIDPLNYNGPLGLAKVYIKKRYFTQAEKYLKKLIKINEKRIDAYLTYSELYIIQNKLSKAEKKIKRGEYFHPDHPDIYYYFGLINDKNNNKKEAQYYYEKAYYKDHDNPDTVLNLADIYFSLRQWDKAAEFINNSLNNFPDMPLLYNKLALAYQFNNNIDKALDNFKKTYELNTTDDIIKYHLENLLISKRKLYNKDRKKFSGLHFQTAKKFDENFYKYDALYEYKRGLQIHSDNKKQRYNLAKLYKRMGFHEKYLKELKIVLMLDPGDQLLKDKFEKARTFKSTRLSYKLGINQYKIKKDRYNIFIPSFNKKKNSFINNQTGKIIADSINNHLNLYNKFRVNNNKNDNTDYYFYLQRNEIKKIAKQKKADYYVFGQFTENSDFLSVDFKLFPVKQDEPVKSFTGISRGKDKLYFLSKDIASQINDFFKVKGAIIKIKTDNNIIINLGKNDRIKKGDKIEIYNKGSIAKDFDLNKYSKKQPVKTGSAKIIRIDEQIAEARLEKLDYINKVSLNDTVYLIKKKGK